MFHVPNHYRFTDKHHCLSSDDSHGNNGAFMVPVESYVLLCIASDGSGWEHVSVSFQKHTPSWKQMCAIKDIFWDPEDVVVQYHPRESDYVNMHEHCLHLWRPIDQKLPTPSKIFV